MDYIILLGIHRISIYAYTIHNKEYNIHDCSIKEYNIKYVTVYRGHKIEALSLSIIHHFLFCKTGARQPLPIENYWILP